MKFIAAAVVVAGLTVASGANASVSFFEGFDGYTVPTANGPHTAGVSSTTGDSFTSDYSFRTGTSNTGANSMYDEGTWTIGTNPEAVHNLWIGTPDNTDPFLMLNGAPTPTTGPNAGVVPVAWESQGIAVTAGTYDYSYKLLNLCCNSQDPGDAQVLSPLQLWYTDPNGVTTRINIGDETDTPESGAGWVTLSGHFDLAAGGTIHLGLTDQSGTLGGNDFGVDSISFSGGGVPEPAAWALMILGFGGVGASLRAKRRQAIAA
jgi:hypothetical protein